VHPGVDTLQTALNLANSGDQLVLADGTYTGSGGDVLKMDKSITIRAQNAGQAVLDGESARRVVDITMGTINIQGLNITAVTCLSLP
jgi:nitrous oxidase accessory protein NosD